MIRLPRAPGQYDQRTEAERNRSIEAADKRNHKRGSDVEIGNGRLILTSPDGSRFNITVANDGTISATAI